MALTEVTPTTDPYDISTQVQEFKEAYYGEDVRDGIINLANKLNNELNDFSTHEFVSVDDTLTVSGEGADARVTGQRLDAKVDKINPTASGEIALGTGAQVNIDYGIAIGPGAISNEHNFIAIGNGNISVSGQNILCIGNGSYDPVVGGAAYRKNALTLDVGGNLWVDGDIRIGGDSYASGSPIPTSAGVDAAIESYVQLLVSKRDVSNNISGDDSSTTKVPSVKAIKDYVDSASPAEIVGTFTPSQQLGSGSEIKLRQVGNIVYVQGMYGPDASTPQQSLGTGTGVAVPTGSREWLPCVTTDFQNYHAGYVALSKSGSTINFTFYGNTQDQILIINAFYIV